MRARVAAAEIKYSLKLERIRPILHCENFAGSSRDGVKLSNKEPGLRADEGLET
jgi:hypothetical protein